MLTIDRKPENSAIEEQIDGNGLTLRWNQPSQPARGLLIGYSVAIVGFVGFWELQHLNRAVQNQGNFNGIWSFMLAWIFVLHLVHLVRMFRPMVPESVWLSANFLQHDSGRAFFLSPLTRVRLPNGRRIIFGMTPRHIEAIPVHKLDRLVFSRYAGRRSIRYSSGRLEVEIGQFLSEADREWLSDLLQAWRAAAGA